MIIVYAALGNTIKSSAWAAARSTSDPPPSHSSHFFTSGREDPQKRQSKQQQPESQRIEQMHQHQTFSDSKGPQPTNHTIDIGRPELRGNGYTEDEWRHHDRINPVEPVPPFEILERSEGLEDRDTEKTGTEAITIIRPSRVRSFERIRHHERDLERGSAV